MALCKIIIQHFRNIQYAEVTPIPTINFIIGENGSGKTNFLESLYTLGHGRSFRHHHHHQLIEYHQPELNLFAQLEYAQQYNKIGLRKTLQGHSNIRINNNDNHRISDLAKLLPMQLMNPEGINLLMGGPKHKRAFIDWGCFHLYPEFYTLWVKFKRGIKQRNQALRQATQYKELTHWDQSIITIAEKIHAIRTDYIASLIPQFTQTLQEFLPNSPFTYQLTSGWENTLSYQESLLKNFERDRLLKHTSTGPHKADLKIRINQQLVEEDLSRGQLKLLMCALRLAQGIHFQHVTQQPCIYLLDDFTSELDPNHQQHLMRQLRHLSSQVFISAIELASLDPLLNENDKIFKLDCGKITT